MTTTELDDILAFDLALDTYHKLCDELDELISMKLVFPELRLSELVPILRDRLVKANKLKQSIDEIVKAHKLQADRAVDIFKRI